MKCLFLILLLTFTANAQYVLKFDAQLFQHVEHGQFFETSTPNNPVILARDFAWEGWIKIDPAFNSGYVISAGYGGAHAILAGFDKVANKYGFIGNFWTAADAMCTSQGGFSFSSEPVFYPNVWYHFAVASRNRILTVYKNGVPISAQSWVGERYASVCNQDDPSGSGLYIGGSDHLNFTGSIGAIRGWEDYSPYHGIPFIPEVSFRSDWRRDDGTKAYPVLLADYTQRGSDIADLSNGYNGRKHAGHLHSATQGLTPGRPRPTGRPLPKWVEDTNYPSWADTLAEEPVGSIPAPAAVIADTFTRPETNLANGGGLGRTETGQTWTANALFGIQNERAVSLYNTYYGSALVDFGSSGHVVSVSRGSSQSETGLRISSTDFNNGCAVFTEANSLILDSISNGAVTRLSVTPIAAGWRRLKVQVDQRIRIYVDNLLVTTYEGQFVRGAKVGLYQYSPGIVQYDDFTASNSTTGR